MVHSIQDYLRKINSTLTRIDCISLLLTCLIVICFVAYLKDKQAQHGSVSYIAGTEQASDAPKVDPRPFASSKGKTYTFTWCQNSTAIAIKNKIYFVDEAAAQQSGRTLSKLCQK